MCVRRGRFISAFPRRNVIRVSLLGVPVAQKEEHGPPKSGVAGSNPARDISSRTLAKLLFRIGRFHFFSRRSNVYVVEFYDTGSSSFMAPVRWEMKITPTHFLLFILTFVTTTAAGAMLQGFSPMSSDITKGLVFSLPLLFILISHEVGHLFALWRYGVRSSFPYFIPAPNIIGTFGAIMFLRERIWDASKILTIGAAGPIAGFLASIPVALIGLKMSSVVEPSEIQGEFLKLGSPLIFSLMERIFTGGTQKEILLHPVAFAAWIGFFVTSINLIPVGQTDGGHIVFSLFPKVHRPLSFAVSLVLVVVGIVFWYGWVIWGILTLFLGMRGSPYVPRRDVGFGGKMVALISLLIFVLSFVLIPIRI